MVRNDSELKVLVVEDSKVTMRALCNYLVRMGITQPLTAVTGHEALEIFRNNRPDIVLLDAILPDIDGFDIAKQMRALEKTNEWTAIIFLTSMDKDKDIARGIESGGDDYLLKPISAAVLSAKIRAMGRLVEKQRTLVEVAQKQNVVNKKLQRLSTVDALTGIGNRRSFDDFAGREWRRCLRMKKSLSLVMLDVDYFKLYNDTYGHQAGDMCLKVVAAQVARSAPRAGDLAARYGGEEFALILGETTLEGATWVANHICQHVFERKMAHSASPFKYVTVSCGATSVVPHEDLSLTMLLKAADNALYRAKALGRNKVVSGDYWQPG
ncbi:MAG: diguanylate cyclase [Pseudomonadota bacterium]